jgi:hypothetical protein
VELEGVSLEASETFKAQCLLSNRIGISASDETYISPKIFEVLSEKFSEEIESHEEKG